jgi:hypothetical protein
MEHTLLVLLRDYWPLVLFALFGGYLLRRGARRNRDALAARNMQEARQHGMAYAAPGGLDANQGVIPGTHRFSGTTRGVPWHAEVTMLTSEVDDGLATRRNGTTRYTRWFAPAAGTGGGELLLMALPEGVHPQAAKANPGGGFLGGLLAKAAWVAGQAYVRLNFGNDRASSLSITPEDHLTLPADAFGMAYTAFGNPSGLLQRLSPPVRDWLLKGHHGRAAFLWDARGLALTWPTAHLEPEEVAACAEYGVVLVELLREARFLGGEITARDSGGGAAPTSR